MTVTEEREFFMRGGTVTRCEPGTPKDLQRIIRAHNMFGGARAFANALAYRNLYAKGDIFGPVAKPFVKGHRI